RTDKNTLAQMARQDLMVYLGDKRISQDQFWTTDATKSGDFPYAHRMTPAAIVPVYTPQEAIEEATYAVRELGLKVIMIANHVRRPVPAFARQAADATQVRHWVDSLAFESAHDYDPLWARCVELKVAVTAHSGSMGWMGRE